MKQNIKSSIKKLDVNSIAIIGRAEENFALSKSMGVFVAVLMKEFIDKIDTSLKWTSLSKVSNEFYLPLPIRYSICRIFIHSYVKCECGKRIFSEETIIPQIFTWAFLWAINNGVFDKNYGELDVEDIYKTIRGGIINIVIKNECDDCCDPKSKPYLSNTDINGNCCDYDINQFIDV